MAEERTAGPHDFWWTTCGIDTHERGSNYARLDTPWNAFTEDHSALVCTLWTDLIVKVDDKREGRTRRFIRMGGRSKRWQGGAVKRGREALANLQQAIETKLPIFGYEAEPNKALLERGERAVKHFYMDRARQLKAWIGLSRHDLDERLHIDRAFTRAGLDDPGDPNLPPTLFELVDATTPAPGSRQKEVKEEQPSEEDEVEQQFDGNLSADEYARLTVPLLVQHVFNQSDGMLVPLTYVALAQLLGRQDRHGRPWARGLGEVLTRVSTMIDGVAPALPDPPPCLTGIVVLATGVNAGLPGEGIAAVWPGYGALSQAEKRAKLAAEYQRILQYGTRWNTVLERLGLDPVAVPEPQKGGGGGWGGGESAQHRALKRFVLVHPDLLGVEPGCFAQEEYALRSGDEVDVMFKLNSRWTAVEVKSKVSDRLPSDYERGLYQVVKYRAVLEAQALVDHGERRPAVRAVLLLEGSLPAYLRPIATALGVEVIEEVRPAEPAPVESEQVS